MPKARTAKLAGVWRKLNPKSLMVGALLIVSFLAFTGHGLIRDPDFWWHVRTGEWILNHHALPAHDFYTFWNNPKVWINHEWLSEVLMWLVYSHWGAPGIVLIFAAVTLAGFILMVLRAELDKPPYLILGAGALIGLVAGGPIWGPRPQMLEFFFVALELLWLERYLRSEKRGWAGIYWLPLVMILWANLHGSWPIAFLFLGAAIAAQIYAWLLGKQEEAKRRVWRLLLVSVACAVALLLTPNGPAELLYPFQTQGSAAQQALIQEWFSPDFHQLYVRPFEVMLFVALIGFIVKRPNFYSSLLILGTLAMALESVRHIALFVLAVTPSMIGSYTQIWREHSATWTARLEQGGALARGIRKQMRPSQPKKFAAGLVIVTWLAMGTFAGVTVANEIRGQTTYDNGDYPVQAANWVIDHPQSCLRIYDQYGWGGYLVYRFYPAYNQHQVYIFGEAALMGDAKLNEYYRVAILAPDWETILDQQRVDCVLYNRGTPIADALKISPKWSLVHEDTVADIFVRR